MNPVPNPEMQPLPLDTLLENVDGMRRLARRLVRDPALADDVAQDAVLVALSKGPRTRRNVRGWLNGIVRNVARNSRRSTVRRTRHEGAAGAPGDAPDPLGRAVQIAEQKRLLDAVEALPEPYRETVWQRYFEDRKPRAIARESGVPVETVRTRLKRAQAMLRTRLDAAHDGDRRAWALALAPLGLSGSSWVLPSLIGGALVTTKTKVGALAALVLLAAGGLWWVAASDPTTDVPREAALAEHAAGADGPEAEAAKLAGRGKANEQDAATADASAWRIRGRAVDAAGAPLSGVTIRAGPIDVIAMESLPVVARSRADGTFHFRAPVDATSLRIVARSPARLDALARVDQDVVASLELRLPAAPLYVFRVLDGKTDEPLEGVACVTRRKERGLLWDSVVHTDAQGVVALPNPTADTLENDLGVRMQHPGYRTLMKLPRPKASSLERPREVYLFPAPRLVLEAHDPQGLPVPGVRIRAWAGNPSLSTEPPEWRMDTMRFWSDGSGHGITLGDATTNDEGRVVFDMGPRPLTWFAHASGDGLAGMAQAASTWKMEDTHVVIRMEATGTIEGRITDSSGAPVARARVECTPWYIAKRMREGGSIPVPPDVLARTWRTMTGADGTYVLDSLPLAAAPAELHVSAYRGDLGMGFQVIQGSGVPGERKRVDLVVETEHEVRTVRVEDEEGQPVVGALVTFANMRPGMLSDAAGMARLIEHPGVQGPFRAYKQGYVHGSAEPGEDEVVEITLARAHTLRGRVFDKAGTPRGAYVDVYDPKIAELPKEERNQLFTDLWFGRTHADAGGHFRLDDLPPGPYFVRAWYTTYRAGKHHTVLAEQHATGRGPIEVRLPEAEPATEPAGSVQGTVVDADGNLLTDYWLTLENPRGSAGPDLKGRRFRFEDVVPGTWKLTAGAEGGALRLETSIVVRANEQTDVRVVLKPSLSIKAQLVDAAGKGIANTYVQLFREGGRGSSPMRRTDADGRFAMKDLLPGRYRARVRLQGEERPHATSDAFFEIDPGQDGELRIEAEPAATLTLELDDERFLVHSAKWYDERHSQRGQRTLFSRVTVTTASGEELVEVGLFHGRRRFLYPLAPGNYDLLVKTHKEGSFRTSFTVTGAKDVVIPVVLEKDAVK